MASSVQLFGSPSGIFMRALPDAEQEELPYEISSLQCYSFIKLFYSQLSVSVWYLLKTIGQFNALVWCTFDFCHSELSWLSDVHNRKVLGWFMRIHKLGYAEDRSLTASRYKNKAFCLQPYWIILTLRWSLFNISANCAMSITLTSIAMLKNLF